MLLIQKYPSPNITPSTVGGNNWALSESSQLKWREENARIDFNLTKSQSLMFRYTQDSWVNPAPTGGVYWGDDFFPGLPAIGRSLPNKSLVSGPPSSAEAPSTKSSLLIPITASTIGVGGSNPGLQQQICDAIGPLYSGNPKNCLSSSIPTIWGGFGAYGSGQNYWVIAPWQNQLDIYTVRDDLSKVIGNHTSESRCFPWLE